MCSWEPESYVAVKGQTLILTRREGQKRGLCRRPSAVALSGSPPQSCNLVDSSEEGHGNDPCLVNFGPIQTQTMSDIERYLHQMTQLLRPEDSIKLVVRLESLYCSHLRYLAVVSCMEQDIEEFCLLGFDCDGTITIGLVLAILSHTVIRLDGDGGFCVTYGDGLRSHIFKPVSVQTMWSALQSLYTASECAKKNNSFQVSAVRYYDSLFQANKSDLVCLNEWNLLPGVETKRPVAANMSSDELSFQQTISSGLREILMSERDLDEVSSKEIRTKLEHKLNVDLSQYKSFIDEEMLKILGQMEAPAMILENLYLGTEWNASHQQDLFDKGIGYILNVTAEIDNFFPDTFRYMNIPVSDNEETDLLRYFNDSYRFINEAHKMGKNVLVHCKMGISRSATIVIAYVMKNRNWDLLQSMEHVRIRRTCVKPNPNFMKQLEVYEGLLAAKRFSDTLEKRSKSESNLKQSDFSLVSAKKNTLSSSNTDIRSTPIATKKSSKKYYNTAPARLRPERSNGEDSRAFKAVARLKSSFSRPKSCSCAAIPFSQDSHSVDDEAFVQREVLDSFQNAVQCLEQSSPSIYSLKYKIDVVKSPSEASSLPNIKDCWVEPQAISEVRIIPDVVSSFVTTETLVLNSPNRETASVVNYEAEIVSSSVCDLQSDTEVKKEGADDLSKDNFLVFPEEMEASDQIRTTEDFDALNSTPETPTTRQNTNLKCCRRPFNGHTFSVSPNQVVNISSIGNFSKFSVRHLVNEFESQSSKHSLSSLITGDGQPSLSAMSENLPVRKSNTRKKSPETPVSIEVRITDKDGMSSLESSYSPGESEIPLNIESEEAVVKPEKRRQPKEVPKREDESCSDKESKSTRLPFWKLSSSGMSKNDRNAKEAASNTIVRFIKSHTKKAVESTKPREKQKDSRRSRPKLSHPISNPKEAHNDKASEATEKCITNPTPLDTIQKPRTVFQKTGVVKQRLEAFEAKSAPVFDNQLYSNRSHNRSHSATTSAPSSTPNSANSSSSDKFALGHKRKSSMPHLNTSSLISDTVQPNSTFSASKLFDRKGSLDSNTLLKSLPCISSRAFTVRGFQNPAIPSVNSKFPLASERHQKNQYVFSTPSSRQQHGSTHPLKLLPQTTKLSQ